MAKLIKYFTEMYANVVLWYFKKTGKIKPITNEELVTDFTHTFDPKPQLDVADGEFIAKEQPKIETQKERDAKTRKRKYYSNKPANDSRGKSKKGSVATKNA